VAHAGAIVLVGDNGFPLRFKDGRWSVLPALHGSPSRATIQSVFIG